MSPNTFLKSVAFSLILWFSIATVSAQVTQKIGGNPYAIDAKAVLELESTTRGFLLPRMTEAQMNLITTPTEGMIVYCTDCGVGTDGELRIAYNSVWQTLKGNLTGDITGNAATVTTNANLTGAITSVGNVTTIAASPALTGTPTAPTAAVGTNTTQIATTAFVTGAAVTSLDGLSDAKLGGSGFTGSLLVGHETTGTITGTGALGNTGVGVGALLAISNNGSYNTATGYESLKSVSSGQFNTAVGYQALKTVTTALDNTAFGSQSLRINTGTANTAIGNLSLVTNTTGSNNTAIGASADVSSPSLTNTIAIGFEAKVATSNTIQLGNANITNVQTSGTLTADAVTYPKAHGTTGQVLSTTGSGILTWATPSTTATAYSGILPVANGGTGSSTQNFVDLTTAQTVAGVKTFSSDLKVNGLSVGLGLGNVASNTVVGKDGLKTNTTGFLNTAFGSSTLMSNLTGSRNTAVGSSSLYLNDGNDNSAFGYNTMQLNTTGDFNVSVGSESLKSNTTGLRNTALGTYSMKLNINGTGNTAIGYNSLINNTSGQNNTASGSLALSSNTTATYNSAFGVQALEKNTTGAQNTAIGVAAIDRNTTGAYNAVLGAFAGRFISDGTTSNTIINNSVLIGANTRVNADNETNQIVIGYGAIGNGSNTIQLGNTGITNVKTSGTLTADAVTYPKAHGATGQVLSTTGSGTLTWITASVIDVVDEFTATAAQTSFTLTETPSANSKIKMYVNGIRISKNAHTLSGTTLTYVPANNGGYALAVSDRIQIDYFK